MWAQCQQHIYDKQPMKTYQQLKKIIKEAKAYLKQQGIDQWQNGYPDDEALETDVKFGITYVLIIDGKIAGTAALHQGLDVNYLNIHDGEWVNGVHGRYTAIHRIAMSADFRGQHLSDKMITGWSRFPAFLVTRTFELTPIPIT